MSGFAVVSVRSGMSVEQSSIEQMVATIAHRGPDGRAVMCDGPVGLGGCLLRTTSTERTLPYRDGVLAVTGDIRIDNRSELIGTLNVDRSKPPSDVELVLAAYRRWGVECPDRLIGAFAFALHDSARGRLFCARDHVGIKPFYYHESADVFAAATESKAFNPLETIPDTVDETTIADYLAGRQHDATRTFRQAISRLPPGHAMTVTDEDVARWQYWTPEPSCKRHLEADEDYADGFRKQFVRAVRCRLRGTDPPGCLLSGGLDSSAISSTTRQLSTSDQVNTYSLVFDRLRECDERPYIEAVLQSGGFESTFVRPETTGPLSDIDRMLYHEDGPFHASNLFLHWELYRAAQEDITVLLDGFGGDSAVSHGLGYLPELLASGRFRKLLSETRAFADRVESRPQGVFRRHVIRPAVPPSIMGVVRRLQGSHRYPNRTGSMIDRNFARRTGVMERLRADRRGNYPLWTEQAHHRHELEREALTASLEMLDKAAAAFGIEPRYPLLDRRLIEFCLALPPDQKLRDGWTRFILRKAMADTLPPAVRWRGHKADLSPCVPHGIREHDRDIVESVMDGRTDQWAKYVDTSRLRTEYRRLLAGKNTDPSIGVWRPIVLARWLKTTNEGEQSPS